MNMDMLLDEWDAMLVAKHFPGRYKVPYINNMNVSSSFTGVLSEAFTINDVYNCDSTPVLQNPGTKDYILAMWCPSLTVAYGDGAGG